MELLLALVIFGVLLAITVFGYRQSEGEARRRGYGDFGRSDPTAQAASRDEQRDPPPA
jgi:hypothetical protein